MFKIEKIESIPIPVVDTGKLSTTTLWIIPEENTIKITQEYDTNSSYSHSYSHMEYIGREFSVKFPNYPTEKAIREIIDDLKDDINIIIHECIVKWNGYNIVGSLTKDAYTSFTHINDFILNNSFQYDDYIVYDAEDYVEDYYNVDLEKIDTREDVESLIQDIEDSLDQYTIIIGLYDYIIKAWEYRKNQ